MSRRLLNRSGRPAGTNLASPAAAVNAILPEYEPLLFPLNDSARRNLGDLSNNRGTVAYEAQLKDSVRHLGLSVGDLHERLRARKDRLADVRTRREERGTSKSAEEERLEEHVADFEKEIEELTRQSEWALREVVDRRVELEDEAAVLGDLHTTAATHSTTVAGPSRRKRTNEALGEEADDASGEDIENPTVTSILATFREHRAKKLEQYNNLSLHERYALNNDYGGFKKLWHDAAAGENGPPLPDASRWFFPNGDPDMTIPGHDGLPKSDDDDVAVCRENISINCPLTLLPMTEPYSNHKCPHTFEKAAILDYLPAHGEGQCPQTGCSQTFSRSQFKQDFFLDEAMLRRIRRTKQAEQDYMDDDDDDDEANESLVVGTEHHVRGGGTGRAMKRERTSTIEP